MKPELGANYVRDVRRAYPEVPGMADLCVFWFRRAHDELKACTTTDPVAGRAGLVGTQNVRNNASRIGGLDHIAVTGTIVEAVENQPWSGEANVHVSIANWVKTKEKKLLPSTRRLWFKASPLTGARRRMRGSGSAAKQYELDMREVAFISSSLSDQVDVSQAAQLEVTAGYCYTGQYPRYNDGFVLSLSDGSAMRAATLVNKDVVHPFAGGDELLDDGTVRRFVIDFQTRSIVEAQTYVVPFKHVKDEVLPYVQALAKKEQDNTGKTTGQDQNWLNTWWQHFRCRPELIGKITPLSRYLVCSRVTKRPIFMFLSSTVRPSDALSCFALDDDYSFGVLQSQAHYMWFHAKCSNMKSDPRYTSESIFSTFPWPQAPSTADVNTVVNAARELLKLRESASNAGTGLRALYRTLELPGKSPLKDAHSALDTAVLKAYGFSSKRDLLQQLLDLNAVIAANFGAGKDVTGPGVPATVKNSTKLISTACFAP